MRFSENSDITLVVTSCGRFDLLKETLESFDRYNTAPIREVFITEDSGDDAVHDAVPAHWKDHCTVFVNRPKLGQLASIDLAYGRVKTPYIFHCEDDWRFYRQGFVEDSRAILEASPDVLQVWLRSHAHDLAIHSPYIHLGDRQVIAGVPCYPLLSDKAEWQAFSLNPGLRRLSDYQRCAPFADYAGEKALSRRYAELNLTAITLEGDAVLHTGFGSHVTVPEEVQRKAKRRQRDRVRLAAVLVAGVLIGTGIGFLVH
ncbi:MULTISPECIES: glycosyltransferase family 2 protein [Pseudomonas]|uniref:glycosyltransferase family 2 protein n=1 Tax=Pseudomonas TaxID=286 RepID=UPI001CE42CDC|nr:MULTISPECIES: glycosyltransferase family 2 protein [Pseudomonas]MCO7594384.1 glycosyltransferase family 2 protein [Pseudomonas guariconensis]MCU7218723.1 glycosyltransferase family 2 protein [Pseudomonas brassicacearum]